MKEKIKALDNTYAQCKDEGIIKPKKETDRGIVRSLLASAQCGIDRAKRNGNEYEEETNNYSFLFVEYYDILRKLIDAFLLFDKVQISNHQCSNAYLCFNHRSIDVSWEELEKMRLLRNEINYKGKKIGIMEWNVSKPLFEEYILSLLKRTRDLLGQVP